MLLALFLGMCVIDWPRSLWGKVLILLLLHPTSREVIMDGLITFGKALTILIVLMMIVIITINVLDIVAR